MKVHFKKLNVQCKLASEMHKVKCSKQKREWQMLNVECENLNVQPAELERELEYREYEKLNVQGKNLNVARGMLNDESANSDVKHQCRIKREK